MTNRFRKSKKGFSMAELLLVVAIIVILLGVGAVGVLSYQRSMQQLEMDGIAKEIFVAAQNHLLAAEGQDYLERENFGTEETKPGLEEGSPEIHTGIYYFIVGGSGSGYTHPDDDSVLGLMLPLGAVDETVRLGGSYIVRYQKEPAVVLDVFYCERSGKQFGHTFSPSFGEYKYDEEYRMLMDSGVAGYYGKDHASDRRNYVKENAVVGWYGGTDPAEDVESVTLQRPMLIVRNAERLEVEIFNPNGTTGTLQLIVTGKLSGKSKAITILPEGSDVPDVGSGVQRVVRADGTETNWYRYVLDSVTDVGGHFYDLFGGDGFIPGENISVKAVALSTTMIANVAESSTQVTNSIFATGSTSEEALISNVRHLENLDMRISCLDENDIDIDPSRDLLTIGSALQITDLSWSDFLTRLGRSETRSINVYAAKGGVSKNNTFMPVKPTYDLTYDGNYYRIEDVVVNTDSGEAGLFSELDGGSIQLHVQDLDLVCFDVTANAGSAGALAGISNGSNVSVSGVRAYNDNLSDDSGYEIHGTGYAGGLIGRLTGGSVMDSAASVYVRADSGVAGGLIGRADGSAGILRCYSGGHTQNGMYLSTTNAGEAARMNVVGSTAGGLIGRADGVSVKYSYSTCSANGAVAGGLIGSLNGGSVEYDYATGLVTGGTEETLGAFIGTLSGSPSVASNKYYEIINFGVNAVGSNENATGVSALDESKESYEAFVCAGNGSYNPSPALPYDPLLSITFRGRYHLQTVSQVYPFDDTDEVPDVDAVHIGDWPSPETLVRNTKTAAGNSNGDSALVFYGEDAGLPEGTTVHLAELNPGTESYETYRAETAKLLGVEAEELGDIKLMSIELIGGGTERQPQAPVSVLLHIPALADAKKLSIVHFGAQPELLSAEIDGGTVYFETSSFSTFAFISNLPTWTVSALTEEGDTLSLTCDATAELPQDAALEVRELIPDEENKEVYKQYKEYLEQSAKLIERRTGDLQFVRFFVVSLKDAASGKELQPAQDIGIRIEMPELLLSEELLAELDLPEEEPEEPVDELPGTEEPSEQTAEEPAEETLPAEELPAEQTLPAEELPAEQTLPVEEFPEEEPPEPVEKIDVIRLGDEPELKDFDLLENGVEFCADTVGIYAVIGTFEEHTVEATDEGRCEISLTYDKASGIPEDAKLRVTELTEDDEEYAAYLTRSAEVLGIPEQRLITAGVFAVEIRDPMTGARLQPEELVKLGVRLLDGAEDAEELSVVRFRKDAAGKAKALKSTVNDGVITFDTTRFSVIVLCRRSEEFLWGDYTYTVPETGEVLLSGLLERLGVEDVTTDDVMNVSFYDENMIEVEQQDSDWLLRLRAPLGKERALTMVLSNGQSVQVRLTNEVLEDVPGEDLRIPITITAKSASKVYDGTPLEQPEYTVTGEFAENDMLNPRSVVVTGSQTNPGTSRNVLSGMSPSESNPSGVQIQNTETGNDVTANYNITLVSGTLTVWKSLNEDVRIELTGFNGNIASYRITVDLTGASADGGYNNGQPLVLRSTFGEEQSIDYASIRAVSDHGDEVTYDYSSNTGTYFVPDNDRTVITYNTKVNGKVGQTVTFTNNAVLQLYEDEDEGSVSFAADYTGTRTITPTGTDIMGTGGVFYIRLFTYAQNHMEEGLGGSVFRLLDSNMRPMTYKAGANAGKQITFETGDDGYVDVTLNEADDGVTIHKNTVYFLEMIAAPFAEKDGEFVYYQKDNTYYSFLITDVPSYKYGDIYSYFNGDVLKVRCYPESRGINVTKRFAGNYTLTKDQQNAIRFILQKEALDTAAGWLDVESHTYAEFTYGSMNFATGRVSGKVLEDNATYRVIEENALPAELAGIVDENISVSESYQVNGRPVEDDSNEFFIDPEDSKAYSYNLAFTNEYIDHKLTLYKIDEMTGRLLEGAEFSVYAAGNENDSEPWFIAEYVSGEDGTVTIRKADGRESSGDSYYEDDQLYYVVETAAPEGYILPKNPEKVYFYFSDGSEIPFGLPEGETATNLTSSYNSLTLPNDSAAVDVPVTVVWGIDNSPVWPETVASIQIGLYRSVGEGAPVQATDNEGHPLTVTLTKEDFYNNTAFTALPAVDDNGERYTYTVEEELILGTGGENFTNQYARAATVSGTGWYVVNNRPAISVTVTKQWLSLAGVPLNDSETIGKPHVEFRLYRTTEEIGKTEFTRDELLEFLGSAQPVSDVLTLAYSTGWSKTIDCLQQTDNAGNPYRYYVLETLLPNQEDSYTLTAATESDPRLLTIKNQQTPITVTVQVLDCEKTYGDDDPAYAFATDVMDDDSTVTITPRAGQPGTYTLQVYDQANDVTTTGSFKVVREAGDNIGDYAVTISEGELSGYRLLFTGGTLTINQAEITVTASAEKTYGEADPVALITAEGLKNGDGLEVLNIQAEREMGEDVGEYPITLIGEVSQGNYIVNYVPGSFTIHRANVTVTAANKTKTYGEDDPEFTATAEGLQFGDALSVIDFVIIRRNTAEDVGEYPIVFSGAQEQGNYNVTFVSGTLTINRATVTIGISSENEKTYGDEDPEWEVNVEGLQFNDDVGDFTSVLDETTGVRTYTYSLTRGENAVPLFSFTANRVSGENIGEYAVTAQIPEGQQEQGNYRLECSETAGKLVITRAELTVTPADLVKALGVATDPLLTAEVSGWKNGDEQAQAQSAVNEWTGAVTWTYTRGEQTILTYTLRRDSGEDEGEYTISANGASEQSNYTVYYEQGAFSILSVLDVDVVQPLVDHADPNANPSFSYTAKLDLTGTGLTEYEKNGFAPDENNVPTAHFTLPENEENMKTLKVPANAKLTVTQDTPNDNDVDYTTAISIDGEPYSDPENPRTCVLAQADTFHEIAFTHTRISLPVEARAAINESEENANVLPGREGAMGIPRNGGVQQIDLDFANTINETIGYTLPTDKYYVYDHASLYYTVGETETGVTNVTEIRYESGLWQYRQEGAAEYANVPDGAKLVLFYLPKYVCKIGTEKYYSLKDAVNVAAASGSTDPVEIEMLLGEYSLRHDSDAATIPEGCSIVLTTATTEYEGTGTAVISRNPGYTGGSLIVNNGTLELGNIIFDGKDVQAGAAMIENHAAEATLTVGQNAALQNAHGVDGGAICVNDGTVTVKGTLSGNTAENGGAIYLENGTVTFGDGESSAILTGNSAVNGGAVYAEGGTISLNRATVTNNEATNGGVIYLSGSAEAELRGTLGSTEDGKANSAVNGGAVYMTGGTLTVYGTVKGNQADNGGAFYVAGGEVSLDNTGEKVESNTAAFGGAIYQSDGTLTVLAGELSGNSASPKTVEGSPVGGSGGAVYLAGGTFALTDGSVTGNNAENGGAIYGAGGAITIAGGEITANTAAHNGGALCCETATVSIEGGSVDGNTATAGSGGAVWTDTGAVTVSDGSVNSNTAAANGGAIFSARGNVAHSGGEITGNSAVNGAALYIGTGSANLTASITGNAASNGGAIGVGSESARLYFEGAVNVYNNKYNNNQRNVCLDVDSDQVIQVTTLTRNTDKNNQIGVYVPGTVDSEQVVKHGDLSGYFGTYATDTNVASMFKNDAWSGLTPVCENKRIFWSAKLTYDVVYKAAFDSSEPPKAGSTFTSTTSTSTIYNKVKSGGAGYPHGGENNEYSIYELITGWNLYNTYTTDFNNRAGSANAGAAAVYAYTYANASSSKFDNGLTFSNFLTSIKWNTGTRKWEFYDQNGNNLNNGSKRLVIIYSAPAYITVTNNNNQGLPLTFSLTVNGRDAATEHFGYATAKNGVTVETLTPLAPEDLVLQAGESVKLLFPGSANKEYVLTGAFAGAGSDTQISYTINGGEAQTITGADVNISGGTLPNDYSSEEIVFGSPLPICRLVWTGDGNSVQIGEYATLTDAKDAMVADSAARTAKSYRIEMLVDYLIPKDDVLDLPAGYDVTFTTTEGFAVAEKDGTRTRAILSRDFGNNGSSVVVYGASPDEGSRLTATNLIFDGRAVAGTGNGGAISTRYCDVTVDNCKFMGYRATRGGAIFTVRGTGVDYAGFAHKAEDDAGYAESEAYFAANAGLRVLNSTFENCQTNAQADKAGGGAVWTTAKGLYIENCEFNKCSCDGTNVQGGAVFHNIVEKTLTFKEFDTEPHIDPQNATYEVGYANNTKTTIEDCTFTDCVAKKGSGGTVESDSLDVTVRRCTFNGSYTGKATTGSGGAINVYSKDPLYENNDPKTDTESWVLVDSCQFIDCRADNGNKAHGGVIRTTTWDVTLRNSTFKNSKSGTGGAVSMMNSKYARKFEILGCTFENCAATENGGAVSAMAQNVLIGDYVYTDNNGVEHTVHTSFIDCTSIKNGGAFYQNTHGVTTTIDNCTFTNCTANGTGTSERGGGGIYTNAPSLSVTGQNTSFDHCTAALEGGGIYQNTTAGGSNFTLTDGSLSNCEAMGNKGGAVYTGALTVTLSDCSVTDSKAKAEGGGVWINPKNASTLTRVTMRGNAASNADSKGGGVYIGGNSATVTCTDPQISSCTAAYGGGLYHAGGTLAVTGDSGTISGTATVNGGGLYVNSGTLNMSGSAISGTAAVNGGGLCVNGGKANLSGGAVSGTAASEGGGVYNNAGCTFTQSGGSVSGSAVNGGGVSQKGSYTMTGGTIRGTASENGGAVYLTTGGTMTVKTAATVGSDGTNGSSARNGGGVYVTGSGTLNLYAGGAVAGAAASENGGGIYLANGIVNAGTIENNKLKTEGGDVLGNEAVNGGGVYVAGGTYFMCDGTVAKNTASSTGGGVYYAGGTLNVNGGTIGGSDENANTADKGAGVFVADGQTARFADSIRKTLKISHNHANLEGGGIAVGGAAARLIFKNGVTVRYNTMGRDNTACNVWLDQNSNEIIQSEALDAQSFIGVCASDEQDAEHGQPAKNFATHADTANLSCFRNDRRQYLYGVQGTGDLTAWADFVCKITDANDQLLYKDASGTPAVYEMLENDPIGAFYALNTGAQLYIRHGDDYVPYIGNDFKVQMLVKDYPSTQQITLDRSVGKNVVLTTASVRPDECGFCYNGDERMAAVIHRDAANTGSMFTMSGSWNVTLQNVTFDGSKGSAASTQAGGILHLASSVSVTLGDGATLRNSDAGTNEGGAVYVEGAYTNLVMKQGAVITGCSAENGGGVLVQSGTFAMEGGTITACTATTGGGVMAQGGTFEMYGGTVSGCSAETGGGVCIGAASMYMYGGTITENNATVNGGGIAVSSADARLYFGRGNKTDATGICTVTDNTLADTTRCNVQFNFESVAIINANGLDSRSEIGVYFTGELEDETSERARFGDQDKRFGTRAFDNDKFYCFVNDCDVIMRGMIGAENGVKWEGHPLLRVTKEVVSTATADLSTEEFTFEVQLILDAQHSYTWGDYEDMSFNRQGKATVTLKAGESKTAVLPWAFNGMGYRVTEILSNRTNDNQTENFTVAVKKNDGEPVAGTVASGSLGERSSTSLSEVTFTNTRVTGDLKITKEVRGGRASDLVTEFPFKLTLNDTGITHNYAATRTDGDNNSTEVELPVVNGVAAFTLKDGESLIIHGLPKEVRYTVLEDMDEPLRMRIRTQVTKNGGTPVNKQKEEGTIGEAYTMDGDVKVYASEIKFSNTFLDIVCKITNQSRALLYFKDDVGGLQPAVYSHLEDAFDQINNGGLRTATNGNVSGKLRIEMVVQEYTMERTATLNSGKNVTLSTALYTDDRLDYPYNGGVDDGHGNVAVVYRGFADGSMIVSDSLFTVDKITLDGAADTLVDDNGDPVTADCSGGIVNMNAALKLTVNSVATLRNSTVTGNGGAIWLNAGASLAMNGTVEGCTADYGGGVYAQSGFTTITTTGTITGCKAINDGGAIYTGTGTSIKLNAGTELLCNEAGNNGGAVCVDADLFLSGTVGSIEEPEDGEPINKGNKAGKDGGGIWTGPNAAFFMYSGSQITGNTAGRNGGGLVANGRARVSGYATPVSISGVMKNNTAAENGGAIYTKEDSIVAISGSPALTGNSAKRGGAVYVNSTVTMMGKSNTPNGTMSGNVATLQGGAVFVAAGKTFTMEKGEIRNNKSPEGAISTGEGAVLNFSGNSVVYENTGMDGTTPMNVYLGFNTYEIIRTTGLGNNALIGVYAADGEPEAEGSRPDRVDRPIYCDRGIAHRNFGTYTGSNVSGARLNRFVNDRDPDRTDSENLLRGMGGAKIDPYGADESYYVMWKGKGLELIAKKENANGVGAGGVSFELYNVTGTARDFLDAAKDLANLSAEDLDVIDAALAGNTPVWTGVSNSVEKENRPVGLVQIPWEQNETEENGADFAYDYGYPVAYAHGYPCTYVLRQVYTTEDTVLPGGYWIVTVGRENNVTWIPIATTMQVDDRILDIAFSTDTAFLGETFIVINEVQPTVTYHHNKADEGDEGNVFGPYVVNFETNETNHEYTIDGGIPSYDSHVFRAWATQQNPGAEDYYLVQNGNKIVFYRGTEEAQLSQSPDTMTLYAPGNLTLYAQWDEVVCKITDRAGTLLYDEIGAPLVYSRLEDCFDYYNNNTRFYDKNGGRVTARRIEMLVDSYTLSDGVTLAHGKTVMLTTAPRTDEDGYRYTGRPGVDVCTITRGSGVGNLSMITNEANLTITNVTLDGANKSVTTNGGIITMGRSSAVLTIGEGATLQNSSVVGNGGAICLGNTIGTDGKLVTKTTLTISGGTIQNNQITGTNSGSGAGIYLPAGCKLRLTGSPVFDNNVNYAAALTDSEDDPDPMNGGTAYAAARQDIYLEETQDAPASIEVTGNLGSAEGSIWIWAESVNHYEMLKPFATIQEGVTLDDASYKVFRNAQTDARTICGGDTYLTGQKLDVESWIYWTGGFDVSFFKIDNSGVALPGATFTLFTKDASGDYHEYKMGGKTAEATSANGTTDKNRAGDVLSKGLVLFEKVPTGVYYMKETAIPEKDPIGQDAEYQLSEQWYIVLVGEGNLTVPAQRTDKLWSETLGNLAQEDIDAQRGALVNGKFERGSAIFLLQTQTETIADPQTGATSTVEIEKAVVTPDVLEDGILNIRTDVQKVILRKIDGNSYQALEGAKFNIRYYNGIKLAEAELSLSSGVLWIGELPYGMYYLEETEPPAGYAAKWFYLTVDEDEVLIYGPFDSQRAAKDAYLASLNGG